MKNKLIVLISLAYVSCHTNYASQQERKFSLIAGYMYCSLTAKEWKAPSNKVTPPNEFFKNDNDTMYFQIFSSSGKILHTIKFIKIKTDEFKEPNELHGFPFLGVYIEPKDLPGFYLVMYGNLVRGFCRNFVMPRELYSCGVTTLTNWLTHL